MQADGVNVHLLRTVATHFGLPDLQPEDSVAIILEYLKRLKMHEIQTFHQI